MRRPRTLSLQNNYATKRLLNLSLFIIIIPAKFLPYEVLKKSKRCGSVDGTVFDGSSEAKRVGSVERVRSVERVSVGLNILVME